MFLRLAALGVFAGSLSLRLSRRTFTTVPISLHCSGQLSVRVVSSSCLQFGSLVSLPLAFLSYGSWVPLEATTDSSLVWTLESGCVPAAPGYFTMVIF